MKEKQNVSDAGLAAQGFVVTYLYLVPYEAAEYALAFEFMDGTPERGPVHTQHFCAPVLRDSQREGAAAVLDHERSEVSTEAYGKIIHQHVGKEGAVDKRYLSHLLQGIGRKYWTLGNGFGVLKDTAGHAPDDAVRHALV